MALPLTFPDGSGQPGDLLRRDLQADILKALETNDWSAVDAAFTKNHAALLIGDSSGVRWEKEHGWMSLDGDYAIASQTKLITALTVYRLMAKSNGTLTPDSRVAQFIDAWPQEPASAGANVTLAHLLAFTTGFDKGSAHETACAQPEHADATWADCVDQIAKIPIEHAPGHTYLYGPWHMVVAAAVAHRALGRELTNAAWIESVRSEVFDPAGISSAVHYDGVLSDFPAFVPVMGSWYQGSPGYPDFSGGLRMTGRQWQMVLHAVQFGGLLGSAALANLTAIHTADVDQTFPLDAGSYGYAQGCWRVCDAASAEQSKRGTQLTLQERRELCGADPHPRVVHSIGAWGYYAWMDLTHGYYGVLVFSYAVCLVRLFWIGLFLSVTCSLGACCCCTRFHERRRLRRLDKERSQVDDV